MRPLLGENFFDLHISTAAKGAALGLHQHTKEWTAADIWALEEQPSERVTAATTTTPSERASAATATTTPGISPAKAADPGRVYRVGQHAQRGAPRIQVRCDGHAMAAILDSGSDLNIFNSAFRGRWRPQVFGSGQSVSITTAHGRQQVRELLTARIALQIPSAVQDRSPTVWTGQFLVLHMPEVDTQLLLGNPFLHDTAAIFDYSANIVSFQSHSGDPIRVRWTEQDGGATSAQLLLTSAQAQAWGPSTSDSALTWTVDPDLAEDCSGPGTRCRCSYHADKRLLKKADLPTFLVNISQKKRTKEALSSAEQDELQYIKDGLRAAGFQGADASTAPSTTPTTTTPAASSTGAEMAAASALGSEDTAPPRKRPPDESPTNGKEAKRARRDDTAAEFEGDRAGTTRGAGGTPGPGEAVAPPQHTATLDEMAQAMQRMVQAPHSEPDRRRALLKVLVRFHANFVTQLPRLAPRRPGFDTDINFLPTTRSIRAARYRMTVQEQEIMRRKVEELVDKGYWTPGSTPFSVTAMVVLKPGRSGEQLNHWRLIEDFRLVNAHVTLPANTMPSMDEVFCQLASAKFLTTLDLASGYDQLRCSQKFRDLVGILADGQMFKSEVTSQGFLGSATAFQNLMNAIIRGHLHVSDDHCRDLRDFLVAYLDDLFCHSEDFESHLKHLEATLQRLHDNDLFINMEKARVGASEAVVLGFRVGRGYKLILPDRLEGIRSTPPPATREAMTRWLGVVNFLRNFLPDFPALTKHQRQILARTHGAFGLTPAARAEFERLKQRLLESPVLRLPDRRRTFFLSTDGAGTSGIGAALWQRGEDGRLTPVAFFSRAFQHKDKSRQFASNEVEAYAALEAMRAFRVYLQASTSPFILLTDSTFLERLFATDCLTPRLQRLIDAFSDFNFRVFHLPGASNTVADFLSRQFEESKDSATGSRASGEHTNHADGTSVGQAAATVLATTRAETRRLAQREDAAKAEAESNQKDQEQATASLGLIPAAELRPTGGKSQGLTARVPPEGGSSHLQAPAGEQPSPKDESQDGDIYPTIDAHLLALLPAEYRADPFFAAVWEHTEPGRPSHHHHAQRFLRRGHALYLRSDPPRLCLPRGVVRQRLFRVMHVGPEANHAGARTMLAKLATAFYWPKMLESLLQAQLACMSCQVNKPARRQLHGWYQPFLTAGKCFLDINIDLATALPEVQAVTGGRFDTVLIIVDRFSHAVLLEACNHSVSGPDIVDILDRRVYLAYGAFRSVTADGDVRFTAGFAAALTERGARLRQTSKDHAQSNGMAERAVGLTVAFLRNYAQVNQRNWHELLPQAELALANRYVHHLGCSPYFVLHGHEFRARSTAEYRPFPAEETVTTRAAVFSRVAQLEEIRAVALDRLLEVQERLAVHLNVGASEFSVGDWVLVQADIIGDPDSRIQDCRKMGHRWTGPFKITAVRGGNAYQLELHAQTRAHNVVNIEHLKPYEGPDPEGPAALEGLGSGDMFLVEDIVGHREFRGGYQFLVKWVGWAAPRDNSWLPPSALVSQDFRCTVFEEYVRIHQLPPTLLRFPGNDKVRFVKATPAAPVTTPTSLPLQVYRTSVSEAEGSLSHSRLMDFLSWRLRSLADPDLRDV